MYDITVFYNQSTLWFHLWDYYTCPSGLAWSGSYKAPSILPLYLIGSQLMAVIITSSHLCSFPPAPSIPPVLFFRWNWLLFVFSLSIITLSPYYVYNKCIFNKLIYYANFLRSLLCSCTLDTYKMLFFGITF